MFYWSCIIKLLWLEKKKIYSTHASLSYLKIKKIIGEVLMRPEPKVQKLLLKSQALEMKVTYCNLWWSAPMNLEGPHFLYRFWLKILFNQNKGWKNIKQQKMVIGMKKHEFSVVLLWLLFCEYLRNNFIG